MPFVEISLLRGRSHEMKERLIGNVTNSVAESLECPIDSVIIKLHEMEKADWAIGGVSHKVKEEG